MISVKTYCNAQTTALFLLNKFKVLENVKIGNFQNITEIFEEMERKGMKFGVSTKSLLENIHIVTKEINVDVVLLSLDDLGFNNKPEKEKNMINGVSYEDIYRRAERAGLSLCPDEISFQLRLQYSNQLIGEYIVVATKPIIDHVDQWPKLFILGRNDSGLWLNCDSYSKLDDSWSGRCLYAFVSSPNFSIDSP